MEFTSCSWRLLAVVSVLVAGSARLDAQIVADPQFPFEYVSWGEAPSFIQETLGLLWLPNNKKQKYENMGSGRDDVFPLTAQMKQEDVQYFVMFEFTEADSSLVSVTMLAASLASVYVVPDEFLDYLWDLNLERFGEPTGGKWIPMIGESKDWTQDRVAIKMIRMYLPSTGVLVKYVMRESQEGGAVREGQ